MVLHPILLQIQSDLPHLLLNVAFLDDVTIVGSRQDLQRAFDLLHSRGREVGLTLNPLKSLLWCGPSSSIVDPLDRGVPCAAETGFMLLGAPVGDIPFARDVVHHRIGKVEAVLDALPSINDAQIEYVLLKHCYSFPKFVYCFRTCDPSHLHPVYEYIDTLTLSAFSQLVGRHLDSAAKDQLFLPVKLGGAGLRSAVQHSPAAFVASMAQTKPIVDNILKPEISRRSLDPAFPLLQTETGNATYSSLALLPPEFSQQSLSKEIGAHHNRLLVNNASGRKKARLLSLNLPHAGDFLDAMPSPSLNLSILRCTIAGP